MALMYVPCVFRDVVVIISAFLFFLLSVTVPRLASYKMYGADSNASLFFKKWLSESLTQEDLLRRLSRSGFSRLKAVAVHELVR